MLSTLILGHLYVPSSAKSVLWVHLDDNVVTEITAGDVHVLASVVTTDDRRGSAAWAGHHECVIDAVSYQRSICGGAGNTGGRTSTCEGRSQLKCSEVKPNLTDERVAFAYSVSA